MSEHGEDLEIGPWVLSRYPPGQSLDNFDIYFDTL